MNITINNAIGLLKECLHNGDKGIASLQSWFLGERHLINQTIQDLEYEEGVSIGSSGKAMEGE